MNTLCTSCPPSTPTRCLVGHWGHLFGPGSHETLCRIRFDLEANRLTNLDVKDGLKFRPATEAERADVEDSLINANEDALECPEDYGLVSVLCESPLDWPDVKMDEAP